MNVLSIAAFHNSVVRVVYIIFHVELNISAINVVNVKTNFQAILAVSGLSSVNNEIIFYVALEISIFNVDKNQHF